MTLWSMASVLTLAFIFWLNSVITASPYIAYLSGLKKLSEQKNSVVALLLLLASLLYFFLKVGSFTAEGFAGMVDSTYMQFIWAGPVGLFIQLQVTVAVVWIIYSVVKVTSIQWMLYVVAVGLMGWSFLSIGHGSDALWWGKLALLTHLLVAWVWFGSLNSLRKLATSVSLDKAKLIMERFGGHMSAAVLILLIAGVVMYRSATGQWLPELPLTSYDTVLLAKLVFVALIFLVAALHKLKLVPQLNNESAAKRLKQSITVEMVLAVTIFILASALSSAFSPG
ncbi:copper resistance D family protein [Pseudoalteromonas ruthenica]|uniref:Copper resistance protein D n=1 Tax=Pseudoalteromonas ruthenica TaxID=151081 RepID=A0A0F4PPT8_9GAMM|nr:CopD family protein [Pseudoalteromonas ruthenica]KJY97154.1 copper-binding protein [Pseudoalteromonas ruthenica]KJY99466.1 copper-binding protein [Pseudoalteromonas ruthenica]TMO86838.1 copper-binding protein [Pseudoalteromonas ruthenica]TMO93456.1 copper-binding protein [Pseudoalteromonas ruthenica]TMO96449.1 copper-binding protein [Pseudoalteromonas ruthenica]